ncbi:chemotaxis protein CheW [Synechocystis sp. LKSZ1]|uniref:chemotaxis protein CheW n=1 Tax=Synechocystis sp. LKSZ1 TaxID=3144951 RepID=UPI00336C1533
MDNYRYLRFYLQDRPYALALELVKEIFLLPELIPLPEPPTDIVGVLNLRGKTVPMMHLAKRLGLAQPVCSPKDSVIIFEWQKLLVGLIVHGVDGVLEVSPKQLEAEPDYGHDNPVSTAFLQGLIRTEDTLVPLLNPETLIRAPAAVAQLGQVETETGDASILGNFYEQYAPHLTVSERQNLHQRSINLAQLSQGENKQEKAAFAVIQLSEALIAFPLEKIREFIDIEQYFPVPCAPAYIVGNINLRGEILTIVDIHSLLHLSFASKAKPRKAVVLEVEETSIGIVMDQVQDVIEIEVEALQAQALTHKERHLMGTILQQEKLVSVLDPARMIISLSALN